LLCRCISSVNGGGSTPGIPAHPNENTAKTAKANTMVTSFLIYLYLLSFMDESKQKAEFAKNHPPTARLFSAYRKYLPISVTF
jgi:hypothetical protein